MKAELAILGLMLSFGTVFAEKIEDMEGRAFDGKIVSATKSSVTVERTSDRKRFDMERENLSTKTNESINEFLTTKEEEVAESGGDEPNISIPIPPKKGGGLFRLKLKDDTPKITFHSNGCLWIASPNRIGNDKSRSGVDFFWMWPDDPAAWAKERAESERKQAVDSGRKDADNGFISKSEYRRIEQNNEIHEVTWGEWTGYIIGKPGVAKRGYFAKGDTMLSVKLLGGPSFNPRDLEELVSSVRLTHD